MCASNIPRKSNRDKGQAPHPQPMYPDVTPPASPSVTDPGPAYFAFESLDPPGPARVCSWTLSPDGSRRGSPLPGTYDNLADASYVADLLNEGQRVGDAAAAYVERRRQDLDLGTYLRQRLSDGAPLVDLSQLHLTDPTIADLQEAARHES